MAMVDTECKNLVCLCFTAKNACASTRPDGTEKKASLKLSDGSRHFEG